MEVVLLFPLYKPPKKGYPPKKNTKTQKGRLLRHPVQSQVQLVDGVEGPQQALVQRPKEVVQCLSPLGVAVTSACFPTALRLRPRSRVAHKPPKATQTHTHKKWGSALNSGVPESLTCDLLGIHLLLWGARDTVGLGIPLWPSPKSLRCAEIAKRNDTHA